MDYLYGKLNKEIELQAIDTGEGLVIDEAGKISIKLSDAKSHGLVLDDTGLSLQLASNVQDGALSSKDKRYIEVLPKQLSSLVTTNASQQRDITELQKLVGEGSVAEQISNALALLSHDDVAQPNAFVISVKQEDGLIEVKRAYLQKSDIPSIDKSQVNDLETDLNNLDQNISNVETNVTAQIEREAQRAIDAENSLAQNVLDLQSSLSSTKSQIEEEIQEVCRDVEAALEELETELITGIDNVNSSLQTEISRTNNEVAAVKESTAQVTAELTSDINSVRTDLNTQLQKTKEDFNEEIAETQVDFVARIEASESSLNNKIDSTKTELESDLESAKLETTEYIDSVKEELSSRIDSTNTDLVDTKTELTNSISNTAEELKSSIEETNTNVSELSVNLQEVNGSLNRRIDNLDVNEVKATSGKIINTISQTDGKIAVEVRDLTKEDIPTIDQNQVSGLSDNFSTKQDKLSFEGNYDVNNNKVVTRAYLESAIADIEGVMHFLGVTSTDPATGTITINGEVVTDIVPGDVVIYGTKEFVFSASDNKWHEIGDEAIYITKGTCSVDNTDIGDESIAQKKVTGLETTLSELRDAISSGGFDWQAKANELQDEVDATNAEVEKVKADLESTNSSLADTRESLNTTADALVTNTEALNKRIDLTEDNIQTSKQEVIDKINDLDVAKVEIATGEIIRSISQLDGLVAVEKRALTEEDIPNLSISKIVNLQNELDSLSDEIVGVSTELHTAIEDSAESLNQSLEQTNNYVSSISERISNLDLDTVTAAEGKMLTALSQVDGQVSVETRDIIEADIPNLPISHITDLENTITQINASVEAAKTELNNSINSVSSKIESTIQDLDVEEVSVNTGEVISSISETDGKISVSKKTLTAADIPELTISKVSGLQDQLDSKQGTIPENTYDAYGAASAVQGDTTETVKSLKDQIDSLIISSGGAIQSIAAYDESIVVEDKETVFPKLRVQLSSDIDNQLELKENGLYSHVETVLDEVSINGSQVTITDKAANISVDGNYDEDTNKIASVSTVTTAVQNKQEKITSDNKLSANLIDDALSTNKFVTQEEKETWNKKQNALTIDTAPVESSENVITSGGVFAALKDFSTVKVSVENHTLVITT